MSVKISNCYYHPGQQAVAVCSQCGAGICRECAVKDDNGRIICYKCGNNNLKQEHKQYREELKQRGGRFSNGTEFIVPGIIGILIVMVAGILVYFFEDMKFILFMLNIPIILIGYMLFSIPFGMVVLNDRFAPRYDTLINQVSNWGLKVIFAFTIGWIIFPFYLIRFIVTKIKPSNKNHENIG